MSLQSSTKTHSLVVSKYPSLLKFEHCGDHDNPSGKANFKKLVDALRDFSKPSALDNRAPHDLQNDGKYPRAQALLKKHSPHTLWSVDVCHRGGKDGKYRLVYYVDPSSSSIGQIVAIFIDTHK